MEGLVLIWNWTSTGTGSPDWCQHPRPPLGLPFGRTRTLHVPAPLTSSGMVTWTGSGRHLPSSSSCCCCPTCCLACHCVFCFSGSCCGCGCGCDCGFPPGFSSCPSFCPCFCCDSCCGSCCLPCSCSCSCGGLSPDSGSSPCSCSCSLASPLPPASPGSCFCFYFCFYADWDSGSWTSPCCHCSGSSLQLGLYSCCGVCLHCGCDYGSCHPCWGCGFWPSCSDSGFGCGCGSCSENESPTWTEIYS